MGYVLAHHYDKVCYWMNTMHASGFGNKLKGEPGLLGSKGQGTAGYWLRQKLKLPDGREISNLFAAVCMAVEDVRTS